MQETTPLRKHLALDELLQRRHQIEDVDFWRQINPTSSVSDFSLTESAKDTPGSSASDLDRYATRLREEGYFQTPVVLPAPMLREMRECIEVVRQHGLPVMFALVYDVFYRAFVHLDPVLTHLLGRQYKLVPNFWVYYIEPSDADKGFEPHRDAEYPDTIDASGLPTVLTLWITVTEATPLNSCMYILPKDRDPQYLQATRDLTTGADQLALEDVRALPTEPGVLSCWDQYVFHWGSRSSRRAPTPRVSYAMYCQRGDVSSIDNSIIDLRSGIDFAARLGLICRGMYRYSYLSVQPDDPRKHLLSFLESHISALPSA